MDWAENMSKDFEGSMFNDPQWHIDISFDA